MRITCPECREVLDSKMPKPGRYRPRCKHCGKRFLIKISDETPPSVSVRRDRSPGIAPKAVNGNRMTNAPVLEAPCTPEPLAGDSPDKLPDATMNVEASIQTRATVADETFPPDPSAAAARSSAVVSDPLPNKQPRTSAASKRESEDREMPVRLGGYRLIRILGRGAMGAVYEAKQLSLDRVVALKTIRDRWLGNPAALARFTREAYSAAQLNHHHIVQIYDFGEEGGQHFFSMERVDGASLDEVVRRRGPLEARLAVTYVLQAARGLQHAHANGMVHRDIKPANLLLNRDGVVKVADLGLVKVPDQPDLSDSLEDVSISRASGTQVTLMGTAVGTPAYMAPEQALDAKNVDHRADIYSLGCTLHFLLTGKPPYQASQVSQLLAQHASDPIPNVAATHAHIPSSVDAIISRAMAKRVPDRYPSLPSMINEMESLLGMQSDGVFSPSVADADRWSTNAEQFQRAAPIAGLRGPAILGFSALCGLLFIVTPWIGFAYLLMAPVCWTTAIAVAMILQSARGECAVVRAFRAWCGTLGVKDYVYASGVLALMGCIIVFANLWLGMVVGALMGTMAAGAYHFGLDEPTRRARRASVVEAEQMVRNFRISGADEDGLRMFVARYSGKAWGELFAEVFGADALLTIRSRAVQDPTIPNLSLSAVGRWTSRLNEWTRANRHAIDQRKLSRVEQNALISEGLSEAEARERAWQIAGALMEATRVPKSRRSVTAGHTDEDYDVVAQAKRQRIKAMLADARSGRYAKKRDPMQPMKAWFGPPFRLVAGIAVLTLLAVSLHRAGLLDSDKISAVATTLQQSNRPLAQVTETLRANSGLAVFGADFTSIAIAGMMLSCSSIVSGWRMTPFSMIAVVLVLWGSQWGMPAVGPIPPHWVAALAGGVVMIPGAVLSEREDNADY